MSKPKRKNAKFAVESGQVVVIRGGKQISGPKRRSKP